MRMAYVLISLAAVSVALVPHAANAQDYSDQQMQPDQGWQGRQMQPDPLQQQREIEQQQDEWNAETPAERLRDCAQTSSCTGAFSPYGNGPSFGNGLYDNR